MILCCKVFGFQLRAIIFGPRTRTFRSEGGRFLSFAFRAARHRSPHHLTKARAITFFPSFNQLTALIVDVHGIRDKLPVVVRFLLYGCQTGGDEPREVQETITGNYQEILLAGFKE